MAVESLIILENMVAVDLENSVFHLLNFLKLLHVVGLLVKVVIVSLLFIFIVLHFHKRLDEVFEFTLDFRSINVSSPDNLSGRTHFVGSSQLVVKETSAGHLGLGTTSEDRPVFTVEGRSVEKSVDI